MTDRKLVDIDDLFDDDLNSKSQKRSKVINDSLMEPRSSMQPVFTAPKPEAVTLTPLGNLTSDKGATPSMMMRSGGSLVLALDEGTPLSAPLPAPSVLGNPVSRTSSLSQLGNLVPPQPQVSGPQAQIRPPQVKLPLDVGTRVQCKWISNDSNYHPVRIIERRIVPSSPDPTLYEYYVHYAGYNRRMDEWVSLEQLDLSSVQASEVEEEVGGGGRKKKKVVVEEHDSDSDHGDFDVTALRDHEEFTKVKNIEKIELGPHVMDTWYFSPFPPEFKDCRMLYVCEYSLHFFRRRSQLLRHLQHCHVKHPPGEEIYRNGNVCMFEVDGRKEKMFSQNLCYLAKLFLDHKTLWYDTDLFLFYVLCEIDERGCHVVGYFSKEKCSEEGYNLACILTLPSYQRKGYGKFLISMSYELSKIEQKVGTPERPLSDLGRVSYHGYWTRIILQMIQKHVGAISIKEISDVTAIRPDDIISTLHQLHLIQYHKGAHCICVEPKIVEKYLKQAGGPGLEVDPSKIVWQPYLYERDYREMQKK